LTWIRWDVRTPTHEVVGALAEALKVPTSHALGYYVAACCGFGEYQKDGRAEAVTDATLEDWALWRGAKGRFAGIFRALCVEQRADQKDAVGTVKGWWRQAALLEKQVRDAHRPGQKQREPRQEPPENPPETRAGFARESGGKMAGNDDGNVSSPPPSGIGRLVNAVSGHPHRMRILDWVEGLPKGESHDQWADVLVGCLQGLGMPGMVPATVDDLAAMCTDWPVLAKQSRSGSAYNPAFVKGCVARAGRARTSGDRRTNTAPFVGSDRRTQNTIDAAKEWASGDAA
jgi:hypothetical protein